MENITELSRTGTEYTRELKSKIQSSLAVKDGVNPGEQSEGRVTKQIESITTKIPSGAFLSFAIGSMVLSAGLQLLGRKAESNFVAQWVPSVLILGLYNKLVKLEGSETTSCS